jgi:hypothetical protein
LKMEQEDRLCPKVEMTMKKTLFWKDFIKRKILELSDFSVLYVSLWSMKDAQIMSPLFSINPYTNIQ